MARPRKDGLDYFCKAGIALKAVEDFVERYENISIAGLNYGMFIAGNALFPGDAQDAP